MTIRRAWAAKVDKFFTAVLVFGLLVDPALAFDIRPDPDSTEGSVRTTVIAVS
jgi:hypothetical protein